MSTFCLLFTLKLPNTYVSRFVFAFDVFGSRFDLLTHKTARTYCVYSKYRVRELVDLYVHFIYPVDVINLKIAVFSQAYLFHDHVLHFNVSP